MAGGGFVIFRKDTLGSENPLMLALVRHDGVLDIPKGGCDPGESRLDAAIRECFEECSISLSNEEIIFSNTPFKTDVLNVYCANTEKIPMVTNNPHSGVLEHVSYKWVDKKEFCSNCLSYLADPINHFYSCHTHAYNI